CQNELAPTIGRHPSASGMGGATGDSYDNGPQLIVAAFEKQCAALALDHERIAVHSPNFNVLIFNSNASVPLFSPRVCDLCGGTGAKFLYPCIPDLLERFTFRGRHQYFIPFIGVLTRVGSATAPNKMWVRFDAHAGANSLYTARDLC
ncbi:MAG: hypothetical protein ACYCT0_11240, partial [Sulfobacillus sp.]